MSARLYKFVRVILGVMKWDKKRNTKLRGIAVLESVEVMLMRRMLWWLKDVARMEKIHSQVPAYVQAGCRQTLIWWSKEVVE